MKCMQDSADISSFESTKSVLPCRQPDCNTCVSLTIHLVKSLGSIPGSTALSNGSR